MRTTVPLGQKNTRLRMHLQHRKKLLFPMLFFFSAFGLIYVLALQRLFVKMKLRKKKYSITGTMQCNAIASFVAHFTDSNGNHFLV